MVVKTDSSRREEAVEAAKEIGRELQQKAVFIEFVENDGIEILEID